MKQNFLFIITFLNKCNETIYEDVATYTLKNNNYDFIQINQKLKKLRLNNIVAIKISKDPLINTSTEVNYDDPIIKEITVPYNDFFTKTGIETFLLDQNLNYQHDLDKGFVVYWFENVTLSEIKSALSKFININLDEVNTYPLRWSKWTSSQKKMAHFSLGLDD